MVGHLALAYQVFGAGELAWENTGNQIFSRHARELRCHLLAAAESRQGECNARNPAPTSRKHGRVKQSLDQQGLDACRMEIARDVAKLEAVSRCQGQDNVVLSGCRLKFEIELAAKAFTQCQAPGPIDTAAVGRMDHELHSA